MGALDGVRVIDFGQYIAGPLAGMLLADQGADVIRVEPPSGPAFDVPANATWNRGKRSIVLDLKKEADVATARRLVETADVVIENFRPGVMERLGLGAEALMAANPRLLYCSLPGFAADDPRAELPAWEGVVAAAGGIYSRREQQPIYTAIPISSAYGAILGALSIAMALNARGRDDVGQRIEVPLFDATFAAMGYHGQRVHNAPAPMMPAGGMMGWTRVVQCKDGRYVQFHAGNGNFVDFAKAVGAEDWGQSADLMKRVDDLFLTRTAQEWEDFSAKVQTECAICYSSAEWMDHPHARGSKMVVEVEDPRLGSMRQPGVQVRMSETPGRIRHAAPAPGADGAAIRAEFAGRAPVVAAAAGVGTLKSVLDGVKVLDLCIVLAGPTCGRALAEFGADVVKIDNPGRQAVAFHLDINRAKHSILIDLKKPEGLELFWDLAKEADVIVQNYRAGAADRLGIGYEEARKRNPGIVYASLNAYGYDGPWATRPGHEQLAQASTGMQVRFGGDRRPTLQPYAVNDYGTGFMGAYGVALALLHKQRTGQGQHINTALAYTACTLQSLYFQDYAGKTWDEAKGQDALGAGPMNRLYRASDAWFFFAAPESLLPALERVPGLAGISGVQGAAREAFLEDRFAKGSCAEWTARLLEAGAGAHRVVSPAEIMDDPWSQTHGLSITREVEGVGTVTHIGPSPRLSRTPLRPGRPTPPPGSDAASILAGVNRGADLSRLVELGVVVTEGVLAR